MPNKPKDYSKGKIYVVRNTINDKLYYGSTCSPLHKRWYKHKNSSNYKKDRKFYKAMNELGKENFYIEFVEDFPCNSQPELEAREGYYIRKFNTHKEGYNVLVAGRSKKQHYEDEKESIREKRKEKRNENKDKFKLKEKEWRDNNKESIRETNKKYREKNEDLVKKKKKDYYNENKDKLKLKQKEYYNNNKKELLEKGKHKIVCECGQEIALNSLSKHRKRKIHINLLSKQSI